MSERWSPLAIKVMLHHHCSPCRFEPDSSAYRETVGGLQVDGLLYRDNEGMLRSTELGAAFVRLICSTPIPQPCFRDPRTDEAI